MRSPCPRNFPESPNQTKMQDLVYGVCEEGRGDGCEGEGVAVWGVRVIGVMRDM